MCPIALLGPPGGRRPAGAVKAAARSPSPSRSIKGAGSVSDIQRDLGTVSGGGRISQAANTSAPCGL
jgi:hypothetical protein